VGNRIGDGRVMALIHGFLKQDIMAGLTQKPCERPDFLAPG
jgi:hypothetical protein